MNCSICGKPINERKGYTASLGNDQKTEVSWQHTKCSNTQFSVERDDEDED